MKIEWQAIKSKHSFIFSPMATDDFLGYRIYQSHPNFLSWLHCIISEGEDGPWLQPVGQKYRDTDWQDRRCYEIEAIHSVNWRLTHNGLLYKRYEEAYYKIYENANIDTNHVFLWKRCVGIFDEQGCFQYILKVQPCSDTKKFKVA